MLQCVAVCRGALQSVAVACALLAALALLPVAFPVVWCSFERAALCCSVLQCVAVCCSVFQCVVL